MTEPATLIGGPSSGTMVTIRKSAVLFVVRRNMPTGGSYVVVSSTNGTHKVAEMRSQIGTYARLPGVKPAMFLWQGWGN